jgi:hypothetical protein
MREKETPFSYYLRARFLDGVVRIAVYTSLSQFLLHEDVWATETAAPPPYVSTERKWNNEARLRLMAGRQQSLGQVGLFAPLLQDASSLLFTDVRYFRSTKHNSEGNFGLAHRQIVHSLDWIFGGYGFFDNRWTEHHNQLQQGTLGLEALSVHYDLRANVYIPLSKSKKINSKTTKPTFRGHSEYFNKTKEFALRGLDYEIGRSVPNLDCLRLYVAGYNFQAKGVESINGIRTRFRLDINRYINIDGEYQYDNVRHSAPYIGFTIRIPFGEVTEKPLTALEKRMQTDIVRDIDIVTRPKETPQPSGRNFIFTRPGANGVGTYEDPAADENEEVVVQLLKGHPGYHHYDLKTGIIKTGLHKLEELRPILEVKQQQAVRPQVEYQKSDDDCPGGRNCPGVDVAQQAQVIAAPPSPPPAPVVVQQPVPVSQLAAAPVAQPAPIPAPPPQPPVWSMTRGQQSQSGVNPPAPVSAPVVVPAPVPPAPAVVQQPAAAPAPIPAPPPQPPVWSMTRGQQSQSGVNPSAPVSAQVVVPAPVQPQQPAPTMATAIFVPAVQPQLAPVIHAAPVDSLTSAMPVVPQPQAPQLVPSPVSIQVQPQSYKIEELSAPAQQPVVISAPAASSPPVIASEEKQSISEVQSAPQLQVNVPPIPPLPPAPVARAHAPAEPLQPQLEAKKQELDQSRAAEAERVRLEAEEAERQAALAAAAEAKRQEIEARKQAGQAKKQERDAAKLAAPDILEVSEIFVPELPPAPVARAHAPAEPLQPQLEAKKQELDQSRAEKAEAERVRLEAEEVARQAALTAAAEAKRQAIEQKKLEGQAKKQEREAAKAAELNEIEVGNVLNPIPELPPVPVARAHTPAEPLQSQLEAKKQELDQSRAEKAEAERLRLEAEEAERQAALAAAAEAKRQEIEARKQAGQAKKQERDAAKLAAPDILEVSEIFVPELPPVPVARAANPVGAPLETLLAAKKQELDQSRAEKAEAERVRLEAEEVARQAALTAAAEAKRQAIEQKKLEGQAKKQEREAAKAAELNEIEVGNVLNPIPELPPVPVARAHTPAEPLQSQLEAKKQELDQSRAEKAEAERLRLEAEEAERQAALAAAAEAKRQEIEARKQAGQAKKQERDAAKLAAPDILEVSEIFVPELPPAPVARAHAPAEPLQPQLEAKKQELDQSRAEKAEAERVRLEAEEVARQAALTAAAEAKRQAIEARKQAGQAKKQEREAAKAAELNEIEVGNVLNPIPELPPVPVARAVNPVVEPLETLLAVKKQELDQSRAEKAEAERLRLEAEEIRKAEQERKDLRKEAKKKRLAEQKVQKAKEDEETRLKAAEEEKRLEEEARIKTEENRRRRTENKEKRRVEIAAEKARVTAEAAAARKVEEEEKARIVVEQEQKRKAEEAERQPPVQEVTSSWIATPLPEARNDGEGVAAIAPTSPVIARSDEGTTRQSILDGEAGDAHASTSSPEKPVARKLDFGSDGEDDKDTSLDLSADDLILADSSFTPIDQEEEGERISKLSFDEVAPLPGPVIGNKSNFTQPPTASPPISPKKGTLPPASGKENEELIAAAVRSLQSPAVLLPTSPIKGTVPPTSEKENILSTVVEDREKLSVEKVYLDDHLDLDTSARAKMKPDPWASALDNESIAKVEPTTIPTPKIKSKPEEVIDAAIGAAAPAKEALVSDDVKGLQSSTASPEKDLTASQVPDSEKQIVLYQKGNTFVIAPSSDEAVQDVESLPQKFTQTIFVTDKEFSPETMERLMTNEQGMHSHSYLSLSKIRKQMEENPDFDIEIKKNPARFLLDAFKKMSENSPEPSDGNVRKEVVFNLKNSPAPVAKALREFISEHFSSANVEGGTPLPSPEKKETHFREGVPASPVAESPGYGAVSSAPPSPEYGAVSSAPPSPGYGAVSSAPPSPGYGSVSSAPPSPGYGAVSSAPPSPGYGSVSSAPPSPGYGEVSSAPPSPGYGSVSSAPPSPGYGAVSSAPPSPGYGSVSSAPPSPGYGAVSSAPPSPGHTSTPTLLPAEKSPEKNELSNPSSAQNDVNSAEQGESDEVKKKGNCSIQ